MSKKIICKNEDDVQIEFSYEDDAEFFLISCDGIYSVSNNVVTSENTMTDGSTYQGSTTKQRNIVITAEIDSDYQARRDFLYKSFKPKSPGTFYYEENEEQRQIDYIVENIDIDEKGVCRNAVISLICPDPFFKDPADTTVGTAFRVHTRIHGRTGGIRRPRRGTCEKYRKRFSGGLHRNRSHHGSNRSGQEPGVVSRTAGDPHQDRDAGIPVRYGNRGYCKDHDGDE